MNVHFNPACSHGGALATAMGEPDAEGDGT
jgi:hypothetical protein